MALPTDLPVQQISPAAPVLQLSVVIHSSKIAVREAKRIKNCETPKERKNIHPYNRGQINEIRILPFVKSQDLSEFYIYIYIYINKRSTVFLKGDFKKKRGEEGLRGARGEKRGCNPWMERAGDS